MKIIAAATELCLSDAKKHNVSDNLFELLSKIEADQSTKLLTKYQSPAMVKKSGAFRFICYEIIVREYDVTFIIFLRIFHRGNSEYSVFCLNPDSFCAKSIPEYEWQEAVIKSKLHNGIKPRPELSEIEKSYLFYPMQNDFAGSLMIYESREWVTAMKTCQYKPNLSELILRVVDNKSNWQNNVLRHEVHGNLGIIYKYYSESGILFLSDVFADEKSYRELMDGNRILKHFESDALAMVRKAYRSYPDYVLYDTSLWMEIQNESEGNLALSVEEAEILNSVIHHDYNGKLFPLFINGRAGSGKSTILFYIFAHILVHHIRQQIRLGNPPVFLTYSPRLLSAAKAAVRTIIKNNAKIQTALGKDDIEKVNSFIASPDYDLCFRTFKDFQLSIVRSHMPGSFDEKKYYRYRNFKEEWSAYCQKNPSAIVRNISPEFAWYVIRTFIKGMRSPDEDYLDSNEYRLLPKELKTISDATFETIYKYVFEGWYLGHLKECEYWDDQDLTYQAIALINQDRNLYPAVFCDEAQDFSSIEIDLISRLTFFGAKNINAVDIPRVPVAFAGDPLQTINPTGFKWDSIRAGFYEKLQSHSGGQKEVKINYCELNNNYRSSKFIVVFNNIIQLIRALSFGLKDLAPQIPWSSGQGALAPIKKIGDTSVVASALQEAAKTKTIIIPCEEGQERDYIETRDRFLEQNAIVDNELAPNIWSPMNVKGLEYNTVIIYNFGDYLVSTIGINLTELINKLVSSDNESLDLDEQKMIELEYFLNKLYVSASRAKRTLIIVDTEKGYDALWKVIELKAQEILIKYSLVVSDQKEWDINNDITNFQFETELLEVSDDRPEDLANQYYRDGLDSLNPSKLKASSKYYEACGKVTESKRVLAYAYIMEKKYLPAAECFQAIHLGEEAIRSCWYIKEQSKYSRILTISESMPVDRQNIFLQAAGYMLSEAGYKKSILFLRELSHWLKSQSSAALTHFPPVSWDEVISKLLQDLLLFYEDSPMLDDWKEITGLLRTLSSYGIDIQKYTGYYELLYRMHEFPIITDEADRNPGLLKIEEISRLYTAAKAALSPYPQNLHYYHESKDYEKIRNLYIANSTAGFRLDSAQKGIVFTSLVEFGSTNEISGFISVYRENLDTVMSPVLFEKTVIKFFVAKQINECLSIARFLKPFDNAFYEDVAQRYIQSDKEKFATFIFAILLVQELHKGNLHNTVLLLRRFGIRSGNSVNMIVNIHVLHKILLHEIATLDLSEIGKGNKDELQNYVKDLLSKNEQWREIVTVQVAGAAIERLGYHVYARDFYESIYKGTRFTEEDVSFAQRRWLKTKYRQYVAIPESRKKEGMLAGILSAREQWSMDKIPLEEMEEYPEIPAGYQVTLDETIQKPDQKSQKKYLNVAVTVSDADTNQEILKLIYNASKKRLKIDKTSSGETGYIHFENMTFESHEVECSVNRDKKDRTVFSVNGWSVDIVVKKETSSYDISVNHKAGGESSFRFFVY